MRTLPSPLMVVTDRGAFLRPLADGNQALAAAVDAILAAGARWVWFRERDMEDLGRMTLAKAVLARVRVHGGTFTMGGDASLAAAIDADGVHLPGDATANDIRRARDLFPGGLVGVSAHSMREVAAASGAGADYATLSPIFPTASKPGHGPALGLDTVSGAAAHGLPVIGLGGIDPARARACREAGAAGVAVMGGLMAAADPGAATIAYLGALASRAAAPSRGPTLPMIPRHGAPSPKAGMP